VSKTQDPTKAVPDAEKFAPQHVADEKGSPGRNERDMLDVARGSEPERRGAARGRS